MALRPRSAVAATVVAAAAAVDIALGASLGPSASAVLPVLVFLAAALTLAALVERSGLADRGALALARAARGNAMRLYVATCAACAVLTATLSLDGAVVVMVPVVLALARGWGAPRAALLAGTIAVANAVSIAVPLGNPTNLVVMDRLGLSAGEFVAHMLAPGLAAAALCAAWIGRRERVALAAGCRVPDDAAAPLDRAQRHALAALAAAALGGWLAAPLGIAPAWPFAAVAAAAVLSARPRLRPVVPWRLVTVVCGLLVVVSALGVQLRSPASVSLPELVAVAAGVGAAAALVNNLPASIGVAGLLSGGPTAYAALIGLGVGALATPHGSVATMIASDLAGGQAPRTRTTALATGGVLVATLALWGTS